MPTSEETIRVRSRADEKARLIAAANVKGITLSALVRRFLQDGIEGRTVTRQRQDDVRLRMALNRLAALANHPEANTIAAEAKALLSRPRP